MENHEWWKDEYEDSIQDSGARIKAHCRLYYGTTKQDKSLKPCSLRWTELFETRKQQNIVKQAIIDAYKILDYEGVDDIEWLKEGQVGEDPMVVLLAKYRGGGIAGHVDEHFEGPVIVIIVKNRDSKEGRTRKESKKVSFGMHLYQSSNPNAEIINPEYSSYIFWSWFTKFGVHGVPKQKWNDSVVLIIRKDKFYALR